MATIQELPAHLADLIAAGEVVERPASVAKELIENAIDAGATSITLEIQKGGVAYLRIVDNGCGMSAEDAPVAFRRHATSKLHSEKDLDTICTLGFRGEALAAIAAVSRIDLFTRRAEEIAGLHLHLEAGEIQAREEAGCPAGTTFVVRDLFFNTPARMKFLKRDLTEAGHILSMVQHAALSHPEVSFTFLRDGKQVFSTDGKGKLITPVFAVFGKEMTENMVEVPPYQYEGLTVSGYITKPFAGRSNRAMQHFFVNGRYVKSRLMMAAMEEAYRNAIATGKYPSGAVFLTLPFSAVDVNVHPAKMEVKFAQEKPIFEAVYHACLNALAKGDNIPQITRNEMAQVRPSREDNLSKEQLPLSAVLPETETPVSVRDALPRPAVEEFLHDIFVSVPKSADWTQSQRLSSPVAYRRSSEVGPRTVELDTLDAPTPVIPFRNAGKDLPRRPPETPSLTPPARLPETPSPAAPRPLAADFRVIGECFHTYILAEDADGLILIDKHAAHERILFNKLKAETKITQQELLTPVIVELTGEEAAALQERLEDIRQAGFSIDPFGETSFAVRAAPAYLDSGDVPSVISELAAKVINSRAAAPDRLDDLLHTVACRAAIKAGKDSCRLELQNLCSRVLSDEDIRSCPHGRPTTVRLSRYELDKLFKRVKQ